MDRAYIRALKDRVVLSDIVAPHVRLAKKGRVFWGCCPFHQEKTPSFKVDDEKGTFYCFGCHKKGDAFAFLEEKRGLSFFDAASELAQKAGYPLPERTQRDDSRAEIEDKLERIYADAASFFAATLASQTGYVARKYLASRGITDTSSTHFLLGATHQRGALPRALKNFTKQDLLNADLLQRTHTDMPSKNLIQRESFYDRLIFPLRNLKGAIVGFGGRTLTNATPKYRNSAESAVFKKQHYLYGLYEARHTPQLAKTPFLIVEGYLDVIALQQAKLARAVAPLGTALSAEQLRIAFKTSKVVYLCLDGDEAGEAAAFKAAETVLDILKPETTLKFCWLPNGTDPQALIQARQHKAIENAVANAQTLLDVLYIKAHKLFPEKTPEAKALQKKCFEGWCKQIPDYHLSRSYLQSFRERLFDRTSSTPIPIKRTKPNTHKTQVLRQKIFLTTLLRHPYLLSHHLENIAKVDVIEDLTPLKNALLTFATREEHKNPTTQDLEVFIRNQGIANTLDAVLSDPLVKSYAPFVKKDAARQDVEKGLLDLFQTLTQNETLRQEIKVLETVFAKDRQETTWKKLSKLREICLQQQERVSDK